MTVSEVNSMQYSISVSEVYPGRLVWRCHSLTWCFDLSKCLILVTLTPPQLNDQRLLCQVVQELHGRR